MSHTTSRTPTIDDSEKDAARHPYHEYVRSLVEGGRDMMQDLDAYLATDLEDAKLTISVLDVAADGGGIKPWPDLHDESDLLQFMDKNRQRARGSVRMYLIEPEDKLAAGVIEALGAGLDLDPRFFQWSLVGHKHVLSPSHRHHAPYVSIGFGVPKVETANRTVVERFNVTVYVRPDDIGSGWTDLAAAVASPFYALHVLLRLNYMTWLDVVNSIRPEDRRVHGISDTSLGHTKEITKSLAVVQLGGSLDWRGKDHPMAIEVRTALEDDFHHLVQETKFLWQERDKMASVRHRRFENRLIAFTNFFTFIFAPVIIMGIYGMSGSYLFTLFMVIAAIIGVSSRQDSLTVQR